MEDAHAAVLSLEGINDNNAFFAVYDGHGGASLFQYCKVDLSHTFDHQVALLQNLLVRMSTNASSQKMHIARSDMTKLLKRHFWVPMRTSLPVRCYVSSPHCFRCTLILTDPSHTRDPSGCTAVAALITSDQKVYVVRIRLDRPRSFPLNNISRLTQETHGP